MFELNEQAIDQTNPAPVCELLVAVDCSGSMGELSKQAVIKNLLSFIVQYSTLNPLDVELSILRLGDTLALLPPQSNAQVEIKTLLDLSQLQQLLADKLASGQMVKLLLLSDGYLEPAQVKSFSHWRKQNRELLPAAVSVGADANEHQLKLLATEQYTFLAQDIHQALHRLSQARSRLSSGNHLPLSIKEIQIEQSNFGG